MGVLDSACPEHPSHHFISLLQVFFLVIVASLYDRTHKHACVNIRPPICWPTQVFGPGNYG